jgi:hypothetical protein
MTRKERREDMDRISDKRLEIWIDWCQSHPTYRLEILSALVELRDRREDWIKIAAGLKAILSLLDDAATGREK